MKYKVGQQVRVKTYKKLVEEFGRPDRSGDIYIAQDDMDFVADMVEYCGKVVTIAATTADSRYRIIDDDYSWTWTDGMLEDEVD